MRRTVALPWATTSRKTIRENCLTGRIKIVESNDVEFDDELNAAVVDNPGNYDGLNDFDRDPSSLLGLRSFPGLS